YRNGKESEPLDLHQRRGAVGHLQNSLDHFAGSSPGLVGKLRHRLRIKNHCGLKVSRNTPVTRRLRPFAWRAASCLNAPSRSNSLAGILAGPVSRACNRFSSTPPPRARSVHLPKAASIPTARLQCERERLNRCLPV